MVEVETPSVAAISWFERPPTSSVRISSCVGVPSHPPGSSGRLVLYSRGQPDAVGVRVQAGRLHIEANLLGVVECPANGGQIALLSHHAVLRDRTRLRRAVPLRLRDRPAHAGAPRARGLVISRILRILRTWLCGIAPRLVALSPAVEISAPLLKGRVDYLSLADAERLLDNLERMEIIQPGPGIRLIDRNKVLEWLDAIWSDAEWTKAV